MGGQGGAVPAPSSGPPAHRSAPPPAALGAAAASCCWLRGAAARAAANLEADLCGACTAAAAAVAAVCALVCAGGLQAPAILACCTAKPELSSGTAHRARTADLTYRPAPSRRFRPPAGCQTSEDLCQGAEDGWRRPKARGVSPKRSCERIRALAGLGACQCNGAVLQSASAGGGGRLGLPCGPVHLCTSPQVPWLAPTAPNIALDSSRFRIARPRRQPGGTRAPRDCRTAWPRRAVRRAGEHSGHPARDAAPTASAAPPAPCPHSSPRPPCSLLCRREQDVMKLSAWAACRGWGAGPAGRAWVARALPPPLPPLGRRCRRLARWLASSHPQ